MTAMPPTYNGPSRREWDHLERRVGKLEDANVGLLAERIANVSREVHVQARTLTWILRTLVGLAATIIAAAVIYGISGGAG